jgi:hypothetical protein
MLGKVFVSCVLILFAAANSFFSLKYFTLPYLWIALSWIGVLLSAVVLLPSLKRASLAIIGAIAVVSIVEGAIWYMDNSVHGDIAKSGTFNWASHHILGYTADKDTTQSSALIYRGDKLYDVSYTMDKNGFRVTPPGPIAERDRKGCVLVFGDSFTFGWGLNDKDTMPYMLALRSGQRYAVHNLAFLTHGPHQMLASFEFGLLVPSVKCREGERHYVLYQTTPDHVRRVAGIRDRVDLHHGPGYTIDGDGKASYRGQFGSNLSTREKIDGYLAKSALFRKIVGGDAMYTRRYRQGDLNLYFAVLEQARSRMSKMYAHSEMHVLLWGGDQFDTQGILRREIQKGLTDRRFTVHRIEEILPGADQYKEEFYLRGFDPHPNATANEKIANYVASRILK